MSDRYCGLYVTFEKEVSEEYVELLTKMILSFKGVCEVTSTLSDANHHFAYSMAKHELEMKLLDLIREKRK